MEANVPAIHEAAQQLRGVGSEATGVRELRVKRWYGLVPFDG